MDAIRNNKAICLTLFLSFAFGFLFFLLSPKVHAVDFEIGTWKGFYFTTTNNNLKFNANNVLYTIWSSGLNRPSFYSSTTNFSNITAISKVSFLQRYRATTNTVLQTDIECSDSSGVHYGTSQDATVYATNNLDGGLFRGVNYEFSTPIPCDTSTLNYLIITPDHYNTCGGYCDFAGNNNASTTTWIHDTSSHTSYTNYNLVISINGGFSTNTVNVGVQDTKPSGCDTTSFQIFSVDYGKGICDTATSLFIPSEDYWQNMVQDIASSTNSIIFYNQFSQVQSTFTNYSTTTPTTTLLNFRMKITGANFDQNMQWLDMSNSDFQRVWAFPRTVLTYSLWIFFLYYLVMRARSLLSQEPM